MFYQACDVLDIKLFVKLGDSSVGELSTIISDDDLRYPELTHNVFQNKILVILCSNGRQGFNFYPFSKVGYADQ